MATINQVVVKGTTYDLAVDAENISGEVTNVPVIDVQQNSTSVVDTETGVANVKANNYKIFDMSHDNNPMKLNAWSGGGWSYCSLTTDELTKYNAMCAEAGEFVPIQIVVLYYYTSSKSQGAQRVVLTYNGEPDYLSAIVYPRQHYLINFGNQFFQIISKMEGTVGNLTYLTLQCDAESPLPILTMGNKKSYTPSTDYSPATKKYVDDQVGSINTVLATLTTVEEV